MLLLSYLLYIKMIIHRIVVRMVLRGIPKYFSSNFVLHTPVILMFRITIVSGHMMDIVTNPMCNCFSLSSNILSCQQVISVVYLDQELTWPSP